MNSLLVLLAVFPLLHAAAPARYRKSSAVSGGGGYGLLWEQRRAGAAQLPELNVKAGYYTLLGMSLRIDPFFRIASLRSQ